MLLQLLQNWFLHITINVPSYFNAYTRVPENAIDFSIKEERSSTIQLSLTANRMILITFAREHLVIMLQQKVIDHTRASHV